MNMLYSIGVSKQKSNFITFICCKFVHNKKFRNDRFVGKDIKPTSWRSFMNAKTNTLKIIFGTNILTFDVLKVLVIYHHGSL